MGASISLFCYVKKGTPYINRVVPMSTCIVKQLLRHLSITMETAVQERLICIFTLLQTDTEDKEKTCINIIDTNLVTLQELDI